MGEKGLYWEILFKRDAESRGLGEPETLHFEEVPGDSGAAGPDTTVQVTRNEEASRSSGTIGVQEIIC